MENIVYFLFGEKYGQKLLDGNIAFFMLAGFAGLALLAVIVSFVVSAKRKKLEKISSVKDGTPIGSPAKDGEANVNMFSGRNGTILPDDPGGMEGFPFGGAGNAPGGGQTGVMFEKIPFGEEPAVTQAVNPSVPMQAAPIQAAKPPVPQPVRKAAQPGPEYLTPVDEKPGMIPNPLPIPPMKARTRLDYDLDVAEEDDYDI